MKRLLLPLLLFVALLAFAVFAPAFGGDGYQVVTASRLLAPSLSHPFGTDALGRDLFSRVAIALRYSLIVGVSSALVSGALGLFFGLVASLSRVLDQFLFSLISALKALPSFLFALFFLAVVGSGVANTIIILSLVNVPRIAEVIRLRVLSLMTEQFIEAEKSIGAGKLRILFISIPRHLSSVLVVQMCFVFAQSMLSEASLSFLGSGIPAPQPSLGNLVLEGKDYFFTHPHLIIIPSLILMLAVFCCNMTGRALSTPLSHNEEKLYG